MFMMIIIRILDTCGVYVGAKIRCTTRLIKLLLCIPNKCCVSSGGIYIRILYNNGKQVGVLSPLCILIELFVRLKLRGYYVITYTWDDTCYESYSSIDTKKTNCSGKPVKTCQNLNNYIYLQMS